MNQPFRSIAAMSLALFALEAAAQSDMDGAKDHPEIPRVAGTHIVAYAYSDYDEGEFVVGMENRELQTVTAEGKRTRIMYFGTPTMAPLGLLRNYQAAFRQLGEVEEKFACRQTECYTNFPVVFVWHEQKRIPTSLDNGGRSVYANTAYYRDQLYWYGTVTSADRQFHVSVYSAVLSDQNSLEELRGYPTLHLEVVEVADFEPDLVTVTSEEIANAIRDAGHIALYGIYFDVDSASLRTESDAALTQIAGALQADPGLRLYVVGHTDNQGTLDYNQDLSERRARSVVDALATKLGIARDRLVAVGAGLIAPKASNDSEEGRALNRRVELVKM